MYKNNKDAEFLYNMLSVKDQSVLTTDFIGKMNELANSGSVMAMVYWGEEVYLGKRGVSQNKNQAYKWWKTAADMGNPHAKYNMSYGYMNGETVEKNTALALMYALESSEENFPRAFRIIGAIYLVGELFPKNEKTAEQYFLKAIQFCDYICYTFIGNIKFQNEEYDRAFELYRKAALYADENKIQNGYPYYHLARCYEYGNKKDIESAFTYYLKAAQRKHKNALYETAKKIYRASGIDNNKKLALLKEASRLDCSKADYCIGRIYELQKNAPLSAVWFEKGADKGDIFCISFLLKKYALALSGSNENRQKTLKYFQLFFSLYDSVYKDIDDKLEYSFDVYYYAYAVELDIDEFGHKPDRTHSMYYYRKCLDYPGGTYHFNGIASIALGCIVPEETGNMMFRDIKHGIALSELLFDYLDEFMADTQVEKSKKVLHSTK